jgi:hypothetical protein
MGERLLCARAGIVVPLALLAASLLGACGSSSSVTATTAASTAKPATTASAATQPTTTSAVTTKATTTPVKAKTVTSTKTSTAPSATATADVTYGLVARHGLFLLGPASASASTMRVLGKEGKVCWSFAPGVAHKTAAQIDTGAPGTTSTTVLKFGKLYQASGCVTAKASVLAGLAKYPLAYYVSVKGGA